MKINGEKPQMILVDDIVIMCMYVGLLNCSACAFRFKCKIYDEEHTNEM